jgi:hypothetical protein
MDKLYSIYLILFLAMIALNAVGQDGFNKTVFRVKGDLNKDGLTDLVIVKADTVNKYHPYKLEILFAKKDGGYQSVFSSQKSIMPRFPNGDERTEFILEQLLVVKGVLIFTNQRIRGNMTHKFRYQNGSFELIGYTERNAGTAQTDYTDINLSTGRKITWKEPYAKDKNTPERITFEKYSPLPRLQDFTPLASSYLTSHGIQAEL